MRKINSTATVLPIVVLALGLLASSAAAHGPCRKCGNCETTYVSKTVMVPCQTTETRTVMCTAYRTRVEKYMATVYDRIPQTHQETRCYTAMIPETHYRECTYQVRIPVWREVEKQVCVQVPVWSTTEVPYTVRIPVWRTEDQHYQKLIREQVKRQGVRQVLKKTPYVETCFVTKDKGHWEERKQTITCPPPRHCGCNQCNDCKPVTKTVTCKVWVPNLVKEEVKVNRVKCEYVDQPYEYMETVCRYEPAVRKVRVCDYKCETKIRKVRVCNYRTEYKTRKVRVCDYRCETKTRKVPYTICKPVTKTRTVNVTTYKCVPRQVERSRTVCEPYQVPKQIQVPVCKMVPKTIQVAVCCGCGC